MPDFYEGEARDAIRLEFGRQRSDHRRRIRRFWFVDMPIILALIALAVWEQRTMTIGRVVCAVVLMDPVGCEATRVELMRERP